jgi:cytoskeletal protein CcmA (bactofilin family)
VDDIGIVDADIVVNSLIANGTRKGNIEAKEKIEIGKTGVIVGDIKAPLMNMESGSKFTGNCAM